MEGVITDFERDVYRKKISPFYDRLKEGGTWNYEVENGDKFSFQLRDGTNLDVLEYSITKQGGEYDDFKFLLAEVNGVVVGFLDIGIVTPKPDQVIGKSKSNIATIIKGLGIGGKLERTKNYILQKEANRLGTIVDIGQDENKETIETELKIISEKFDYDKDSASFTKKLKNLVANRGNWLSLYGKGGKSEYKHLAKKKGEVVEDKFFKRFITGHPLPTLNCQIEKNTTDLKKEAGKIKW